MAANSSSVEEAAANNAADKGEVGLSSCGCHVFLTVYFCRLAGRPVSFSSTHHLSVKRNTKDSNNTHAAK